MKTLKRIVTVTYEIGPSADVEVSVAEDAIVLRWVEDDRPFLRMPWSTAIAALDAARGADRARRALDIKRGKE